jgi:D-alanyl-D-alanine carboxypeptidase (penicillin-binding protein 5/6)
MPRFAYLMTGVLALVFALAQPAAALESQAREAIILDFDTGAVLFEKDADVPMPPASMSKIMTVFMIFEQLQDGRLSLDDKFTVSEKAWRKGGSKMFVEVGKEVRIEDLLRGVIVQSGNDACIVLAEGVAGTEEAFGQAMTERARELGMENSTFTNATGWPDPDHRTTARDLAILARAMIAQFPEYYHFFSELEFTYNDIRQGNRNPLLYKSIGADGLKTGHTEEAGYGLTASATQRDRRLVLVINGLKSVRARSEESARLMSWGFREFANYALYKAGDEVDDAAVWLGDTETVPLRIAEDLTVTLPRKSRNGMEVTVAYDSPVPAPIEEGQRVARLRVSVPDAAPIEVPLEAARSVDRLGPFGRIIASIKFLVFGAP